MFGELTDFVAFALQQKERAGTRLLLERVCRQAGAYCAILWQEVPGADPPRLFAVADWFEDTGRWSRHDLPFQSLTGWGIANNQAVVTNRGDARINHETGFLPSHRIKTICTLPSRTAQGLSGALNLYWRQDLRLAEGDVAEAERISRTMPFLHEAIQNAFRVRLLEAVNETLQKAEGASDAEDDKLEQAKTAIEQVAKTVGDHFQCLETSIFLEDRLARPGVFEFMGGTNFLFVPDQEYNAGQPGLTGYVLAKKRSIHIYDLGHYLNDRAFIEKTHKGFAWKDKIGVRNVVKGVLGLQDDEPLVPISVMAAPILVGDKLLGAIRCCTSRISPYYFSPGDLQVLELIAAQIGQFWEKYLNGEALRRETGVWRRQAEAVERLNLFVATQLKESEPDETKIMEESIAEIERVFPFSDILDVRLVAEGGKALKYVAVGGRKWKALPDDRYQHLFHTPYSLTGNKPKSVGAYVFKSQRTHIMEDPKGDAYYYRLFSDMKSEIVVPIRSQDEPYGTLCIGTTLNRPIRSYLVSAAELLGQQLGLYVHLVRSIGRLRKAEKDLEDTIRVQTQSYEDLQHQIKSPLWAAQDRVRRALKPTDLAPKVLGDLLAVRGMISKCTTVAQNLSIFVQLAKGEVLKCDLRRMYPDKIYKLLWEACEDNKRLYENRKLAYEIYPGWKEHLLNATVRADPRLLAQAANNLIDNAFKYSYPETAIRIEGGIDNGRFYLAFSNMGLFISEADVNSLTIRGVRGTEAMLVTGEGSGLGLWLVDNIMKAHGGELEVKATAKSGWNTIRLWFPIN